MNAIELVLEILAAAGVRHIFGNPGTTELPLNDALYGDDRFQYYLGLHEIPIMGMADGLAMASGQVGVVNVHTCCGLGNAMGMLYNAHCEGSPLLLLAGQQDRRLRMADPVLAGEMVSVARPWTKWSVEVTTTADVAPVIRQALQTAVTPPRGPVFVSLPVDVQLESVDHPDVAPPTPIHARVQPDAEAIRQAAAAMCQAARPLILAGSRVTEDGACQELAALAESWGAAVYSESATSHGRLPIDSSHPHYRGPLPLWTPEVHAVLEGHDVILVTGMNFLRLYILHQPANPIPATARVIQLDHDARQLAKNVPVAMAIQSDLKHGLQQLNRELVRVASADGGSQAAERCQQLAAERQQLQKALHDHARSQRSQRPMTPLTMMHEIAGWLPPEALVVEEAVTTTNMVLELLGAIHQPANYFGHRGWALGWGLGCAMGVQLAHPGRPTIALLGDGAALYGIQGLWTAARYRIPVTFVICNNSQYKILKQCAAVMPLPQMAQEKFLGMDLDRPAIDFVSLAQSFGVAAHRVTEPDQLQHYLQARTAAADQPLLLDVMVE